MSIAHYFTFLRLFIGPFFLFLYTYYESLNISFTSASYLLLGLLMIAELSDAIDGYLARKLNQVTDFGKLFDPVADSIYRISIFTVLILPPVQLPVSFVFIFLYRDFIINMLRTACALKGVALSARLSGKLKAVFQGFSIFLITLLLVPYSTGKISQEALQNFAYWLVAVVAFYTLFSGVDYLFTHWRYFQSSFTSKKQ